MVSVILTRTQSLLPLFYINTVCTVFQFSFSFFFLQNVFSGSLCMMTSAPFSLFKSDYLYVLLSKYSAGVMYAIDQDCLRMNKKEDHREDDDTNHSVSSIEDDFVTAFEHLDEEDPINTTDSRGTVSPLHATYSILIVKFMNTMLCLHRFRCPWVM